MLKNYKLSISICAVALSILLLIDVGLKSCLVYNNSISEPIGWYLLLPIWVGIKKNSVYIMVTPSNYRKILIDLGGKSEDTLLKTIVGVPNDVIEVVNDGVTVNRVLLKNSKAVKSVRGIELHPLPVGYKYELQTGEYFVFGRNPNSFDSRYFGVVRINSIMNRAVNPFLL